MPHNPFYWSEPWRRFRAEILRERPECQTAGCGKRSKHVDHQRALGRGGAPFDRSNVKALCHSCHSAKTARADGGFGNPLGASADVRAVGCDARGVPLDPLHRWRGGKG